MHSTIIRKVAAVAVCLAFLALVVPLTANAEKRTNRSTARTEFVKQLELLQMLFPYLAGMLSGGAPGMAKIDASKHSSRPIYNARPTGDLLPGKPSDGD